MMKEKTIERKLVTANFLKNPESAYDQTCKIVVLANSKINKKVLSPVTPVGNSLIVTLICVVCFLLLIHIHVSPHLYN